MPNATHKKKKPSKSSSRPRRPVEREVSAGGIVFRRRGGQVEFAIMLDSYGKWAFPKGHVEAGESLEEAAARETLEELGLSEIRLLESLGKIDIWFRDRFMKKGALVHKDIHYYLFETTPEADLHPDPTQHVYEAKWIKPGELLAVSSYPDMVPVLQRALALVGT
jgi:diadenosine hexaphosphate hydrolase (ATP-forming)